MLLQEIIKDWNSGILDIYDDKIKTTGFMSSDGLLKYYDHGLNCIFGMGVYPVLQYDIAYAQDNGLWLILEKGKEIGRHQFIPITKGTVTYENLKNKSKVGTKVFTIRKCCYTNKYNFQCVEKSLLFDTLEHLKDYFQSEYDTDLLKIIKTSSALENEA